MKKISIGQLRFISLIEGISFLLLLFIGMPLKYGFGIKEVNMALGMIHGGLTMVFCLVLGLTWIQKNIIHTLVHWCFYSLTASFWSICG